MATRNSATFWCSAFKSSSCFYRDMTKSSKKRKEKNADFVVSISERSTFGDLHFRPETEAEIRERKADGGERSGHDLQGEEYVYKKVLSNTLNDWPSAISVPQQSITAEKDDSKPTTKRKLNYDDLISHLKHYSPSVRKGTLECR